MGGAGGVGDARAVRGAGVVVVVVWGAVEVTGAARGTVEVDEAHDEEATKGRAVGPCGAVV
jgi:hypothetical protein